MDTQIQTLRILSFQILVYIPENNQAFYTDGQTESFGLNDTSPFDNLY
jgi:hypothetical protein